MARARLVEYRGMRPDVAADAFVAPGAVLVGNVTVESEASIWFGAVLRGDDPRHPIRVGARSSVQDNCVLHVSDAGPTVVGSEVTVGHGAVFESVRIGDGALIGMNAVLLQGVVVGEAAMVAAGSVVLEGTRVEPRTLVAGVPAEARKELDGSAGEWVTRSAAHYVELSRSYLDEGIGEPPGEGPRCERCGAAMLERHCKLVCPRCGYMRDCSDP